MSKITHVSDLRRATKTVVCPACQEKGETFRVSDSFTTSQKATLAAASVVTAGIPVVYYLMGPRANWLAHYCRSCGIRLTTYIQEGDPVFPINSSMLGAARDSFTSGNSQTKLPTSHARSPLGPPSRPVNFKALVSFADRYRSQVPSMILDVDWNKWLDMPVSFWTLDRTTQAYEVSFPNLDLDGRFNAIMFWPSKSDPHYHYPLIWTPERANIRVVNSRKKAKLEVGLVQLAQSEWDVGMYFPKKESAQANAYSSGDSKPLGYDFRHQEIGANHFVFARGHPHFVWSSSEGPLLWTIQRSADGLTEPGQASEDRLILLDCYDRLVAMEHCKVDARWKRWDEAPRDYTFESHLNLRFYGSLPSRIVDEIIVSYLAMSAQMRRKGDWDAVNISD